MWLDFLHDIHIHVHVFYHLFAKETILPHCFNLTVVTEYNTPTCEDYETSFRFKKKRYI